MCGRNKLFVATESLSHNVRNFCRMSDEVMKTAYYTSTTIDSSARAILNETAGLRRYHESGLKLDECALLIIDMQSYFLDEQSHAFVPSALPIVPRIKRLAELFTARGLPVILTRHSNTGEDARTMGSWWSDLIRRDDILSEIIADFDFDNALVVDKTQYDSFYGTRLKEILTDRKTKQVVITGVLTHLCCETTARSAFMRGFNVIFPVDGTATYDIGYHKATFLNASHGFAVPTLIDTLIKRFDG